MLEMKTLLIAEKPSVARDIASVVGRFDKKDGFLENGEYVVSWAFGHIVRLAAPEEYDPVLKKWSLASLPVLPEEFKLTVTEKKQFGVLKKLLLRKDISSVINACDAGREGELIFRWIYKAANTRLPIRRLWLSETTPSAVREALKTARDGREYENLYAAAEVRAQADWIVGINSTRAFTVKHGELFSVGRVQTPTLALIVQREREIRDFRAVPFWQVLATFKTDDSEKYQGIAYVAKDTDRFADEATAKNCAARVTKTGAVEKVQYTEKSELPPTLFNLNDLQREANKLFGMTAAKVLETAQSLYEKKLITYPRTDSRHLTESLAGTLAERIATALKDTPCSFFPSPAPALTKRHVDGSKVSDHHAIIPTEIPASAGLGDAEKKIYELVCRRFLAIFLPPAKFKVMEVITVAGERFQSKGKSVISPGWQRLYSYKTEEDKEDESRLPNLINGQAVEVTKVEVRKKDTKPPARYTDASLLSAMENAGRFIDDKDLASTLKKTGGIGTPATRASILERLIKVGYVLRQKKALVPTAKGETLIGLVPDSLKTPVTTAVWEDRLLQIEQAKVGPDSWLEGIKKLTMEVVGVAKEQERNKTVSSHEVIGRCPVCGNDIVEGRKGFGCSGWKEGCKFVIWKEVAHKKITLEQAQDLLTKKKTVVLKGFKSKEGKDFDAALILTAGGKVEFAFQNRAAAPTDAPPGKTAVLR